VVSRARACSRCEEEKRKKKKRKKKKKKSHTSAQVSNMPLFDLKKNLIFYGAYHREPTNVAVHIACVPMLLATGLVLVRVRFR